MSVNLIRNARVFVTTNVNSSTKKINFTNNILANAGFNASNTFEVQVLDGLSFSQSTGAETVTVSEAGTTPMRGQRSFNTTLEPVDWSFSTYLRPAWFENSAGRGDNTESVSNGDRVTAEEDCLWKLFASHNADTFITGDDAPTAPAADIVTAWNEIVSSGGSAPYAWWSLKHSDKNQLYPFGLIIVFDDVTFAIHNCAMESVSVDFGIDAVATAAWTGRGTLIEKLATKITFGTDGTETINGESTAVGTFGGGNLPATGFTKTFRKKYTNSRYIANKLSVLKLTHKKDVFGQIAGPGVGGTDVVYDIPITGGNITLANNLTYLTPATVGVVNQPCEYFTGTRTITGNVTAYLRSGTNQVATLIANMGEQMLKDDENQFELILGLGGTTDIDNKNKIIFNCPRTMLQIPNITTDQVVSTTINFMPQSSSGDGTYTLNSANEFTVTYCSGPAV